MLQQGELLSIKRHGEDKKKEGNKGRRWRVIFSKNVAKIALLHGMA